MRNTSIVSANKQQDKLAARLAHADRGPGALLGLDPKKTIQELDQAP